MSPVAAKKDPVAETPTTFLVWGWIFFLALAIAGVWGGTVLWRRAQATKAKIAEQVTEAIQSRRTKPPVPAKPPAPVVPTIPSPPPTGEVAAAAPPAPETERARKGPEERLYQRMIRSYSTEFKMCYERELRTNPGLAGSVSVRFVVGGDGRVKTSEVQSSTVGNANLERCMMQKVLRWVFPAPKDARDIAIVLPFVFAP